MGLLPFIGLDLRWMAALPSATRVFCNMVRRPAGSHPLRPAVSLYATSRAITVAMNSERGIEEIIGIFMTLISPSLAHRCTVCG